MTITSTHVPLTGRHCNTAWMAVKPIQSAGATLRALEVIAVEQPVGVASLSRAMDITKSAAQRILATLAESGWIGPAGDGAGDGPWVLTSKAMVVGSHFARSDVRELVLPVLTRVRSEFDETTFLAVRDGRDIVFVAVLESQQRVRVSFPVGTAQPAVHTAAGAVLAFELDVATRRGVFGDEFEDPGVMHRLDQACRDGFAVNLGEDVPEYHNVAAPVRAADGKIVGAIGVSAPAKRMPASVAAQVGRRLVEYLGSLHP